MKNFFILVFSIILLNIGYSVAKLCNNDDILKIFTIVGIFSLLLYSFVNNKSKTKWWDSKLIISAILILSGYYLFIYLLQNNSISKYMIYGNVIGILFITVVGVIYFKEKLNIYNYILKMKSLVVILLCIGIYLLSIKK